MRNVGLEYPARGEVSFYDLGAPPETGPREILIRTRYSGITNGTERHALLAEHGWTRFPGRHGYQHVGTVAAAGEDVRGFGEGDRVFLGRYVGHRGWHVQDVCGADGSHLCIRLPAGIDREDCALLGVAGVAMRGMRRTRVRPAQKVWVAGAGLIGQFAAQAARAFGAEVTVTDVDERRLSAAAELGAHRVIDAREEDSTDALKLAGPFDRIVDACGVESLLLDIHEHALLARDGVIAALAVRSKAVFHWGTLHVREASIEVSCHFSLDDLRVVLHFLERGVIRIGPLVSHRVSIDEAPGIYETLRDRPRELLGVVFDWAD